MSFPLSPQFAYNWPKEEKRRTCMSSTITTSSTSILLICSSPTGLQEQVIDFLLQENFLEPQASIENNPDLHWVNSPEENITIEAVRQLNQEVSLKPYSAARSLFVIFNIDLGSIAAQNALLKLIEEPPQHAQIILTAQTLSTVLPTIQSRCRIEQSKANTQIAVAHGETSDLAELYAQLKNSSLSQVIELSEKYKERADALTLVTSMIHWLHDYTQQHPQPHHISQLERLANAENLLRKNINVRLVIEDCFFHF
jgi:DNA polymerase III delta prime subunit